MKKGAEKLQKFLNAKQQGRLDGFFTAKPKEKPPPKGKAAEKAKSGSKRKVITSYDFNIYSSYSFRVVTRRRRVVPKNRGRSEPGLNKLLRKCKLILTSCLPLNVLDCRHVIYCVSGPSFPGDVFRVQPLS